MKRTILAGACSVLAVIACATPASAAVVIGVGFNGSAPIQVASDGGTGSANYNTSTGGYFYNSSGTGIPIIIQPNLLTQFVNIQQGGTPGTVNLYVTQNNLAAFTGILSSLFTSNTLLNATATITSYYSTTNQLFGGTQIASQSFSSIGTFSNMFSAAMTAPWSTTIRYDITFGGAGGNFNGTANLLATSVPEPLTWAMMLIGFAGLGLAIRRNKNVTARIRFS